MIVDDRRGQTARVGTRGALAVGACVAVIVAGRALAATRPADEATPLVMFTHLYAVLLSIGLLALAMAIGRAVLRRCGVAGGSRIEHGVFSVAVGLGVIAFVVVSLGLAQQLTVPVLAAMVCALAVLTWRDLGAVFGEVPSVVRDGLALRRSLRGQGRGMAMLVPLTGDPGRRAAGSRPGPADLERRADVPPAGSAALPGPRWARADAGPSAGEHAARRQHALPARTGVRQRRDGRGGPPGTRLPDGGGHVQLRAAPLRRDGRLDRGDDLREYAVDAGVRNGRVRRLRPGVLRLPGGVRVHAVAGVRSARLADRLRHAGRVCARLEVPGRDYRAEPRDLAAGGGRPRVALVRAGARVRIAVGVRTPGRTVDGSVVRQEPGLVRQPTLAVPGVEPKRLQHVSRQHDAVQRQRRTAGAARAAAATLCRWVGRVPGEFGPRFNFW